MKNNTEMKEMLDTIWNTRTNTNTGLYDNKKIVSLETCKHNWDDWPYEQGAIHVNFAGREDIVILPENAFNTHPSHLTLSSFILHNMGGRQDEHNMFRIFTDWNKKLNIE
jgi:hypothetical protein